MSKVKINVVVHKSNLSLIDGETLNMFTQKLDKAIGDHVALKLNTKYPSSWLVEVLSDKLIVCAYDSNDISGYYACSYKRDNGIFSFGDLVEVERVESYIPKSNIAKSNESSEEDEEKECGEKPKKSSEISGWSVMKQRKKEGFWRGIL